MDRSNDALYIGALTELAYREQVTANGAVNNPLVVRCTRPRAGCEATRARAIRPLPAAQPVPTFLFAPVLRPPQAFADGFKPEDLAGIPDVPPQVLAAFGGIDIKLVIAGVDVKTGIWKGEESGEGAEGR